jgi:peptidoglycan-associated lipoprotein
MKIANVFAVTALAVLLSACASTGDVTGAPVEDRGAATTEGSSGRAEGATAASGARESMEFQGDALDDPASPLAQRVFYFGFDSDELPADELEVVKAHGAYLAQNPDKKLVLEGHTDERGSREYNLALGERRAASVKRVLTLSGAAASQVEVVSYGEEKPAQAGDNEAAWSKNRRAELLYQE